MATVVVCGAAALLVPAPCEAAGEPLDPALSAAGGEAPASNDSMTASRFTDPDPSDDDEDDDDDDAAPDAPATASDAAHHLIFGRESAVVVRDPKCRPIDPTDGHSLRGPPRGIDETDIDDDDDDDDRFDSACTLLSAPIHLAHDNSRLHSAPARRRSPDGPSLRAP